MADDQKPDTIAGTGGAKMVGRLIASALVIALGACSQGAVIDKGESTSDSVNPREIGEKAARGFAMMECAGLASYTKAHRAEGERLARAGYELIAEYARLGSKIKSSDARKEMSDKVPILVSQRSGGPSPDFIAGRVWEATLLFVDDELQNRSSWSHQKIDPNEADLDSLALDAIAANKFNKQNCDLLIPK